MALSQIVCASAMFLNAMVIGSTALFNDSGAVGKIDQRTAVRLAAEATSYTVHGDTIEPDNSDSAFLVFAVLGGRYGTTPVAWLGVNPWTGDVWDIWACKRLSSTALRRDQAAIRKGFSATQ